MPESELVDLVAGCVGEGIAIKFAAHPKVAKDMPNPTDILAGKVKTMQSKEISAMYLSATNLCYELREMYTQTVRSPKSLDKFPGFPNFTFYA